MFVLYELETGRAHSQSSSAFTNPRPDIYGVKETDKTGTWDTDLLDFVEIPKSNKRKTKLEFLNSFSDTELANILSAAKVSPLVEVFIKKLDAAEFVDISYQPTIDGINALYAAGLIEGSRVSEILNG